VTHTAEQMRSWAVGAAFAAASWAMAHPGGSWATAAGAAPSRIAAATSKVTTSLFMGLPSPLQMMSLFARLLACKWLGEGGSGLP
jgi:hypothetical protein